MSSYPTSTSSEGTVNAGDLLENGAWSGYLKLLTFFTALTIIFDGADNQLLGIAVPTLMKEWGLPRSAFAPLLAIGLLGMMIGGATGGMLGDRIGRKKALIGSVTLFGLTTLAVAAANGVVSLGVLRFVAGLGLGGAMPNAAALASEYAPRRQRPIAVTITIVCIPLGGMLAAYVAGVVLPVRGWRTLFLLGGAAPLVVAAFLSFLLVESPRFMLRDRSRWSELIRFMRKAGLPVAANSIFSVPEEKAATGGEFGALLAPAILRDTIGLWCAFFACLLAVYASFSWIPSLLSGAGFAPGDASKGLLYFNLGGVAGALFGAAAIAQRGSRVTMLVLAALGSASAVVLSLMDISKGVEAGPILGMLGLAGLLINAVQTTMFALATHVYPAENRATGVGAAVSVGRVGGLLSTFFGAWALGVGGSHAYFLVLAAAMAVSFAGLALIRRHITPANKLA